MMLLLDVCSTSKDQQSKLNRQIERQRERERERERETERGGERVR